MSVFTKDFFKQTGDDPLDALRSRFIERFRLMWRRVRDTYAKIAGASLQHYAEAIASVAVSSCPMCEKPCR